MIYLFGALLFGIPILSLIYFAMSLYAYIRAKKSSDQSTVSEMKKLKVRLVVSSVIAALLLSVVVAFIVMLCLAIAYM